MGLWLFEVHHSLDHQIWLYPSHHDKHELDPVLLFDRYHLLVLWQNLQEVDKRLEGAQHVGKGQCRRENVAMQISRHLRPRNVVSRMMYLTATAAIVLR